MKIYTKGGDRGRTSLIGGERVLKTDSRVEAYGTVDELSAQVAMLKDMLLGVSIAEFEEDLIGILRTLMTTEALLAVGKGGEDKVKSIPYDEVETIERRIDEISEKLPEISAFTLPGGHVIVSQTHICRTVCRRAEREACRASVENEISTSVLRYLNRLSDYLYVLGRALTIRLDTQEVLWIPANQADKE